VAGSWSSSFRSDGRLAYSVVARVSFGAPFRLAAPLLERYLGPQCGTGAGWA
jgi:hypothetical protein